MGSKYLMVTWHPLVLNAFHFVENRNSKKFVRSALETNHTSPYGSRDTNDPQFCYRFIPHANIKALQTRRKSGERCLLQRGVPTQLRKKMKSIIGVVKLKELDVTQTFFNCCHISEQTLIIFETNSSFALSNHSEQSLNILKSYLSYRKVKRNWHFKCLT